MNLLPHNLWAIEPTAASALQAQVQATLRAGVSAGPAQEAERSGLPVRTSGGIALVSMMGPMMRNPGFWSTLFGAASTDATRTAILAAGADADVETVIWKVGSPGGSVDGIAELADAVEQVAKVKPVIVQVYGMMASAALYATAHATEIRAGRMDLIGSIGTRMTLYDYSKAFEEAGIKAITVDTGEFKSAGEFGTEITEEQIADFQRIVNGYFADFKAMVMNGRGLSSQQFDDVADGRVWLTSDALNLGLIDKIATLEETIAEYRQPSKGRSTSSAHARLRLQNSH